MTHDRKVPFLDLVSLHKELEPELLEVCKRVIETAGFIGGPEVDGFEKHFAEFSGANYCVGVNSGTDALRFALIAAGVQPGDVVVTVPNTFIATTEAISQAGAQPDFVDVDERTFNMDPEELRRYFETKCGFDAAAGRFFHKATGKPVTAVVPVHLYGQMADMDAIEEIAERGHLKIIEDACQAHGARWRGRRAGGFGLASTFSFYPSKNLAAYGEAGALTTNDDRVADIARSLRDHGQAGRYYHDRIGWNYRMDGFQGAVLRVKLRHVDEWTSRRLALVRRYRERLAGARVGVPDDDPRGESVYHLFVVYVDQRDAVRAALEARGVHTAIHYPVPVHRQEAYAWLGHGPGSLRHTERACARVVSMPLFPEMSLAQVEYAATTLAEVAA